MEKILPLLGALLLLPQASLPARDETSLGTQASRRAWEDAPAPQRTLWTQHRDSLQSIDISDQTERHVIVAPTAAWSSSSETSPQMPSTPAAPSSASALK